MVKQAAIATVTPPCKMTGMDARGSPTAAPTPRPARQISAVNAADHNAITTNLASTIEEREVGSAEQVLHRTIRILAAKHPTGNETKQQEATHRRG